MSHGEQNVQKLEVKQKKYYLFSNFFFIYFFLGFDKYPLYSNFGILVGPALTGLERQRNLRAAWSSVSAGEADGLVDAVLNEASCGRKTSSTQSRWVGDRCPTQRSRPTQLRKSLDLDRRDGRQILIDGAHLPR